MDFSGSDDDSSFSSGTSLPVVTGGVDDMDDALFGGFGSSKPLTQTTSAPGASKKVSFTGKDENGPTGGSNTSKTGGILKTKSAQDFEERTADKPVSEKTKYDFNLSDSDDDLENLDELLKPFNKTTTNATIKNKERPPSAEKSFDFSDSQSLPNLQEAKKIEKPTISMPEFDFSDDDNSLLKSEPSEAPEPRKMQPVVSKTSATSKKSLISVKSVAKSNEDIFASATSVPGFSDNEISELSLTEQTPVVKKSSTRAASPPQESQDDDSFLAGLLGQKKPMEEKPNVEEKPKRAVSEPASLGKNGDLSEDDDTFNMFIKPKKKASSQATKRPTPIIEASPQVSNPPSPPPEIPQKKSSFIPPPLSNYPIQTASAGQQVSDSQLEEISSLTIQIQQLKAALSVKDAQLHELSSNNVGNNDRLSKELNTAREEANLAQQQKLNEAQRCQKRLDEAFVDHQAHVNRMKTAHMEATSMMREEQESQIARVRKMHEEELQAYKTATETTRDVKDLLASVSVATQSLKDIAIRVEEETTKASDHSGLIYEMSALKAVIAAERKNFAAERERFTVMVQEMMKYNREQKEMSSNERLRLEAEIQRIETERRLLEENKIQLEQEIQHKNHENVKYRNTLLDDHQKQIIKVADMKQKLHEDWAELQNAKASIFNSLKPDAFMKYEENLRQAAAAAATSKAALREVELREKQLIEAKDEVMHEKRTLKLEREELSRLKSSVRREEEDIKKRYSDFISDTAEGRTALEAAKRIESRGNDKMRQAEQALQNLHNERVLLQQERRAIETLHRENVHPGTSFNFHEPGISFNESLRVNDLLLDDPMKTILAQNADLLKPIQF